MTRQIALSALFLLAATGAQAQSVEDLSTGFGLSTLGLYGSASYEAMPQLRARGVVVGLPTLTHTEEEDEGEMTVELATLGLAALADYYPTAGGLRLSGGLYVGKPDLSFDMVAGPGETIEVGDSEYSDASLHASASFGRPISPMVAVGYETRFGERWAFDAEIGAIMFGGIDIDVEGENIEMDDLEEEAAQREDDLGFIKAYPWIAIGVSYAF